MKNETLAVDLFSAYFRARANKRNSLSALRFEENFEKNIFSLLEEIEARKYKPKPSICFCVEKPVRREIFAANFSDRVVHHLIYGYIADVFEKYFINDCYSCRKDKGVHYGIRRVESFVRSCSQNYKKDCYVLKLDIKSYFMSMRKDLLYQMVKEVLLKEKSINFDLDLVLYLLRETIFENPEKNCIVKNRAELPFGKSLFDTDANCGLPIGNLTSQLFGNVYLNEFDHYVKSFLKIRYYGRYVDDVIIVHEDREHLKEIVPKIREYLELELGLILHPNKVYLQHFSKGYQFLGVSIKPYRRYVGRRVKGSFYSYLNGAEKSDVKHISIVNSYLGILSHCSSYNLRKGLFKKFFQILPCTVGDSFRKIGLDAAERKVRTF